MKWSSKNISTRIAKFLKMPHSDAIKKELYFEPLQSFLSGRQIAYKLRSNNETVLFYKKANLNAFGRIENIPQDKSSDTMKHFLLPISHKNDFAMYRKQYVLQHPSTVDLRFVGIDHELYEVVYKKMWGHEVSIRKFTNGDTILDLDFPGYVGIGIPLYNSYIPIAYVNDTHLKVLVYNIIDKQLLEIAEYSLNFLEDEIFKYLDTIKGHKSGYDASIYRTHERESINKLLIRYKTAYSIKRPISGGKIDKEAAYEICSNFVICKSFLYVTNEVLRGTKSKSLKPIFVLTFSIAEDTIGCELSIPKGVPIQALGLSKTPKEYIIDTRQVRVKIPNYDYKIPDILYHDESYAIVPSFFDTNKYFIVANDGTKKYVINIKESEQVFNKYLDYNYNRYYHFNIHVSDEFIFFIYKDSESEGILHKILIYNTVKNYWIQYVEYRDNICSFCYIKKCKKLVLFQGWQLSHMKFDIEQFIIIDLAEVDKDTTIDKNNFIHDYRYHIDYISKSEVEHYLRDNHKKECINIYENDIKCDFTIDEKRGVIYMICTIDIKTVDGACTIKFIALEFNLCDRYKFRDLDIGTHVVMTDYMLKEGTPIFISRKSLKHRGMPKYLSPYVSKDFHDFIRNKSFSSDMVFSPFSSEEGIWVRDKYFNRASVALIGSESLRNVVHVFLDNNIVAVQADDEKLTSCVFIIDDMSIVKQLKDAKNVQN
jgi:hypothetical protein